MILVDSSVWIDFFSGRSTPQVDRLDALFAEERIAIGHLILAEVLHGFRSDGRPQARREDARDVRRLGFTVRKTIDTFIATKCIEANYSLLHSDRDFDPLPRTRGFAWRTPAPDRA